MKPVSKFRRSSQSGFTLLEMMVSVTLLVILTGAILGGLGNVQKSYRGDEIRAALNQQVRATMEIISQEVGQAGLPPSGISGNSIYAGTGAAGALATLSAAVAINTTTAVTVSSTALLQGGMLVVVDSGANAELLQIGVISGSTITVATVNGTAGFQKAHVSGVSLYPQGVYTAGISFISPPAVAGTSSFSYQSLIMFGDITGTGTLTVIQYNCPTTTTATLTDSSSVQWGPLTRTEYDYNGTTWSSSTANMLDIVRVATTTYPTAADGCRFDYNVFTPTKVADYMTTSVNVTIIAESLRPDPTTGNPEVVAKSFMNIQPRNILNAYNMYLYNSSPAVVAALPDPYEEFNAVPVSVATQIGTLTQ